MFLSVKNIQNKLTINFLFFFIFLNYTIFFFYKEKTFFLYFGIVIVFNFFIILFKNFKNNKVLISIFIIFCFISLSSPVSDWDGRSIWLFNARIIFFENNLNNYFLYSPYNSHPDYPIFVPVLSATLSSMIEGWNEIFPKFSHIILALPPIIILSSNFNKKTSLIIFLVLILFIFEKRLINGEVDVLLSLYSVSLIKILSEVVTLDKKTPNYYFDIMLIFFHIVFLTMIKIEGLALASCILVAFLIVYSKSNFEFTKKLIFIFILSLIPILIWIIYSKNYVDISSAQKMIGGGERFFKNLFDFKFILHLIGKIMINKQMMISLIIFLFIASKFINLNGKNNFFYLKKIYCKKK